MLIDHTHRRWLLCSAALFVIATVLYVVYATAAPEGPTGGSWQGMAFGVAGSALMIYTGLLAVRKKFPRWRSIGKAQTWLRGHIYLGLLSVPLILFHSGFGVGGLLEQLLLGILAIVVVSGVIGWILQMILPRLMKIGVPAEAIYEQIPAACAALCQTADTKVQGVCGTLLGASHARSVDLSLVVAAAPAKKGGGDDEFDPGTPLREFYLEVVRPFLASDPATLKTLPADSQKLSSSVRAATAFEQARLSVLGDDMLEVVDEIEKICNERRMFLRQQRMHHWLHTWLFVHIPLSVALLVFGILHALTAIYY